MPTQRDMIPLEPEGVFGRMRVAVDSRMNEFDATGPVLKAGPKAASTVAAARTVTRKARREENILLSVETRNIFLGLQHQHELRGIVASWPYL